MSRSVVPDPCVPLHPVAQLSLALQQGNDHAGLAWIMAAARGLHGGRRLTFLW